MRVKVSVVVMFGSVFLGKFAGNSTNDSAGHWF